jgi:hypothetical protein
MAPKYHQPPISRGDRKALKKELSKSRAMTHIFAERSAEKRSEGEARIREADNLGTSAYGRTAAPSIRRRPSIKLSMADKPWVTRHITNAAVFAHPSIAS